MEVSFWHWWILAGLLLALETVAPGAIFLWAGIAAAVVGILVLLFSSLPLAAQLFVFAVLSVATVFLWKKYVKSRKPKEQYATLNRRGEQYIGRRFTLDEAIINGIGKVRVDDTTWKVKGEDAPEGATVKVVDVDSSYLVVEIV